jgi:hypothetical protein
MTSSPIIKTKTNENENILEKTIPKQKKEIALSSFSFLYLSIIQYNFQRVNDLRDLEKKYILILYRLLEVGYQVGYKYYELSTFREKNTKREIKTQNIIQYIGNNIWKSLFSKAIDNIEKSSEKDNQCFLFFNFRFII